MFVSWWHLHGDSHDMAAPCQTGKQLQLCCCSCLRIHPYAASVRSLLQCEGLWQQICQRITVQIQVVPELFSTKQGMQRIIGELVTAAGVLACCRISQLAACTKQHKIPCGLPGTEWALAAFLPCSWRAWSSSVCWELHLTGEFCIAEAWMASVLFQ